MINCFVAVCLIMSSLPGEPAPLELPIEIVASDPPAGAVDARQPSNSDGTNPSGWSSVVLTFTGSTTGMVPANFTVTSTSGTPPTVSSVVPNGVNATVNLSGRIPPGAWTTIQYNPSVTQIVLGYLPGDVDASRTSNPSDILALIDHLNGLVTYPIWQVDLDRSGAAAPADIIKEIDMLNGVGAYAPGWNGVSIGSAPQPGFCTFGRKYAGVHKNIPDATGASAVIRTRSTTLCGEPTTHGTAASAAWVGPVLFNAGSAVKWAQTGYWRHRGGTTGVTIHLHQYAETQAGPNPADYERFQQPGIPSGTHQYRCSLLSPLFGTWTYEIDELPFHTFTHNGWRDVQATHVQWMGEIFNKQDQMPGTATAKCDFTDCQVSTDYSSFQNAGIVISNVKTSNTNEWGSEYVSPTAFNIWDKIIPQMESSNEFE